MGIPSSGTSPKSHCTLGTPQTLPHTPFALESGRRGCKSEIWMLAPSCPTVPIPTPSPRAPISPNWTRCLPSQRRFLTPVTYPIPGASPCPCWQSPPPRPQSPSPIPSAPSLPQHCLVPDQVFGCRLEALCQRENTTVPRFVRLCVEAVEERGRYPGGACPPPQLAQSHLLCLTPSLSPGLDVDGIYRINGNLSVIQKLRFAVDQGEGMRGHQGEGARGLCWRTHTQTGGRGPSIPVPPTPQIPSHLCRTSCDLGWALRLPRAAVPR